MRIKNHEMSHIVELEDGSEWRIWPADLAIPLFWKPSTRIAVSAIDDECCTHVLVDRSQGTRVRAVEASTAWAPEKIEISLIG